MNTGSNTHVHEHRKIRQYADTTYCSRNQCRCLYLFRKPEVYEGRVVLLLGAFLSGLDISVDLAPFVKKVKQYREGHSEYSSAKDVN